MATNLKIKLDKKENQQLKMVVMKGAGPTLIGRQWLQIFTLWPLTWKATVNETLNCNKINLNGIVQKFPSKFPKPVGPCPGFYNRDILKLVIRKDLMPKAFKARHLPFALSEKVEAEIKRLESLGHLEKSM